MRRAKQRERQTQRGFTAVEITMVVTIIAILALLIIPLFRDRVEAARRVAAQDEVDSMVKAELLAFADTGYYYRLQDLDNTMTFNDPPLRPDDEVPIAAWNKPLRPEERQRLFTGLSQWKGPYISVSKFKFITMADAYATIPEFFWSGGGPIMDLPAGAPWLAAANLFDNIADDRIPTDPWGSPYLFFGPGKLHAFVTGFPTASETDFGHGIVYSLGPDGMPGGPPGPQVPYQGAPWVLLREMGALGEGDDYFRIL